jgi:hypothetical protein
MRAMMTRIYIALLQRPSAIKCDRSNNPWLMGMGGQPGLELGSDEPVAMRDLELSDDEDEDMKSDDDDAAPSTSLIPSFDLKGNLLPKCLTPPSHAE